MRIHNTGRKHYYIYQDGKYVGRVTKKKDQNLVNSAPITIKRTHWIIETVYYTVLIGLIMTCLFFPIAHSAAICLALFGTRIFDPFNLDNKTDLYIKRPTGTIDLTDAYDFKTNADVTLRRRRQFLSIRLGFILFAFTMMEIVLIETMIRGNYNAVTIGILSAYSLVYVFLVYFTIKKYLQAMKITKIEKEEQDAHLAK